MIDFTLTPTLYSAAVSDILFPSYSNRISAPSWFMLVSDIYDAYSGAGVPLTLVALPVLALSSNGQRVFVPESLYSCSPL